MTRMSWFGTKLMLPGTVVLHSSPSLSFPPIFSASVCVSGQAWTAVRDLWCICNLRCVHVFQKTCRNLNEDMVNKHRRAALHTANRPGSMLPALPLLSPPPWRDHGGATFRRGYWFSCRLYPAVLSNKSGTGVAAVMKNNIRPGDTGGGWRWQSEAKQTCVVLSRRLTSTSVCSYSGYYMFCRRNRRRVREVLSAPNVGQIFLSPLRLS